MLSPPPGLSQSATSFIASCCQGIHQTPLSRLIRSRRRQALLRDGRFKTVNPSPCPDQKSSTRWRPLGRNRHGCEVRTAQGCSTRARQTSRSVCFKTWKDCLWWSYRALRYLRTVVLAQRQAWRTLPVPHSERTQKRLVFLLSSRCQIVSCRDLAIGREGSSSDEPANRIEVRSAYRFAA